MADRNDGHDRVLAVIGQNSASLLRLARRHSLCADDAQDAYQRALEIYLRKVDQIDGATAGSWLRTVVKHEAMAVRAQRQRYVGGDEVDLDEWISPAEDGEERAIAYERAARGAEALRTCKPDQATAMVLKADGLSYREISSLTGWTHTKVNRSLAEGRKRFFERYAAIESGAECERLAPVLAAIVHGDATADDLAGARPHLRNCAACRAVLRQLRDARGATPGLVPAGVVAGGGGLAAIARVWERLLTGAQTAAIKVQAAVEAATGTKAAAVAASAAALAGGAVAVDRATDASGGRDTATTALIRSVAPAGGPERPIVPRVTAPAARPVATPASPAPGTVRRDRRRRKAPPVGHELGFEAAEPGAQARPAPAPGPAPRGGTPRSESFGFER